MVLYIPSTILGVGIHMEKTEILPPWRHLHFSGRNNKQINCNIVGSDEYYDRKQIV